MNGIGHVGTVDSDEEKNCQPSQSELFVEGKPEGRVKEERTEGRRRQRATRRRQGHDMLQLVAILVQDCGASCTMHDKNLTGDSC